MGAAVYGRDNNKKAPLVIFGRKPLKGRRFRLKISSAQVKSCIMLAALHASGPTEIFQPDVSRDHTERMLEYLGADIEYDGRYTRINPAKKLEAKDIIIPADLSSALFFIVAALINKGSRILIKDVGINPTRSHALDILKDMGGKISISNQRTICNEPAADIEVLSSDLVPVSIETGMIPNIIDEIPILSVAAAAAHGKTVITGAGELRNKESDRIKAISYQFKLAGVDVEELSDGLQINGRKAPVIRGGIYNSLGDHRIAMSLAVLATLSKDRVTIRDSGCIETSFPGFKALLDSVSKENG